MDANGTTNPSRHVGYRGVYSQRCTSGSFGIVAVRNGRPEDTHDTVADMLVDAPAMFLDDPIGTVEELLREKSPSELDQINRATFRAMGASASDVERILYGGAFTPTQSTTFAVHLKALKGVANRGAFVNVAAQKSTTEADALFCVYTAALMNQINEKTPIARIVMLRDFPICIAKDGTIIVALQWDYAAWTSRAAGFTNDVQKLAGQSGENKKILVALSGQVSPRLREELGKRGIVVEDRLVPGPLK